MKDPLVTRPTPILIATLVLAVFVALNLWIWTRFTVDDAFITWRYGRNLVEFGVWNFNPSTFDLTQAYTNPIFAALSVIPAAWGLDMVAFFKLIAGVILLGSSALILRASSSRAQTALVLTAILAIPATIAHAFSGLETYLYCAALALLFIALHQEKWRLATAFTLLLFITRPEAWLLVGLVPAYGLLCHLRRRAGAPSLREWTLLTGVTLIWVIAYFAFHVSHFGELMPNTYFIKSGDGFELSRALGLAAFALPLCLIAAIGHGRIAGLMALYFAPVIYSYASSDLQMNYLNRFGYQIALPMLLYLAYAIAHAPKRWAAGALALGLLAFAYANSSIATLIGYANYYPRLLGAHTALGHAFDELGQQGEISAVAMGDVGAAAFHSRLPVLDIIGLGSRAVSREGLTLEVAQSYAPDVIAIIATQGGVRNFAAQHEVIETYAAQNGYVELCTVTWAPQYGLRLLARETRPELERLCESSANRNNTDDLSFFRAQYLRPPWVFWHE